MDAYHLFQPVLPGDCRAPGKGESATIQVTTWYTIRSKAGPILQSSEVCEPCVPFLVLFQEGLGMEILPYATNGGRPEGRNGLHQWGFLYTELHVKFFTYPSSPSLYKAPEKY